ncbi:ras GEF [Piedraia hortae CBS 480.64]|uniref:Ras GEF n=1 Tax=Piedraia hortae CBS 480.64 TaxID=1314780 RepID=A0A6A7CA67_9PEZI|nr:ras GEF [Piedraia hortae CBS 480.64]
MTSHGHSVSHSPAACDGHGLFNNYIRAFYPYGPSSSSTIGYNGSLTIATIKRGDLILVHSVHASKWADGTVLLTGERGWLPTNYCEAYSHDYLASLLDITTQIWDLSDAKDSDALAVFARQDFSRGVIAGVRYLLVESGCLHSQSQLVLQHTAIRRKRKSLLADLSSLNQFARQLQRMAGEPVSMKEAHTLLDVFTARAFRVVSKAVSFMDVWTSETSPSSPCSPISVEMANTVAAVTSVTQSEQVQTANEGKDIVRPGMDPLPTALQSCRGLMTHRMSRRGVNYHESKTMASEELAKVHEEFVRHIGTFIGHHLRSPPSAELAAMTDCLIVSNQRMLGIMREVARRSPSTADSINQLHEQLQARLQDVLNATQKVRDTDTANLHSQNDRLTLATHLIRVASDCVDKARPTIEQMGDFELCCDLTGRLNQAIGESNTAPESTRHNAPTPKRGVRSLSLCQSEPLSPAVTTQSPTQSPTQSLALTEGSLSPFPQPEPIRQYAIATDPSDYDSGLSTPLAPFCPGLLGYFTHPSMNSRQASGGTADRRRPITTESTGRLSTISHQSDISTRATTPDAFPEPSPMEGMRMGSITSTSQASTTTLEGINEAGTDLLCKTFANELILNKEGNVIGGSLPALVERLTLHDASPDGQFISAFFMTFRMFADPRQLAQALIDRFDYAGDSKAVGAPVRLRVYNVIKSWLADHDALGDIRYFALQKLTPHLPSAGERLMGLVRKLTSYPFVSNVGKCCPSTVEEKDQITPEPELTKSQLNLLRTDMEGGATCSVLDASPLELARQITLMASKIYNSIQADELLSLSWNKKECEQVANVREMCSFSTSLANMVGDSILSPDDAKKRALVINQWARVATHCLELHNYDSVMSIVCTINLTTIQRLKRTWDCVSRKTKSYMEVLNKVTDCSSNHKWLRSQLEDPTAPCIPFLGIYLTDLTFLHEGYPKTRDLGDQKVINFAKYMRMASVVSQLQRVQVDYKLQTVPEIQSWVEKQLRRMRECREDADTSFYRRSLMLEPKQDDPRRPSVAVNEEVRDGHECLEGKND